MKSSLSKLDLIILGIAICCLKTSIGNCNVKLREKFCQTDINCLTCNVGPKCPIPGNRKSPNSEKGTILLRGKNAFFTL